MTGSDLDIANIEDDSALEHDKHIETGIFGDFGVKQHYLKENIPWSAGTVKKTKEDIESKAKSVDSDSGSRPESVSECRQRTDSTSNQKEDVDRKIEEVLTDETKSENWMQAIDGATVTETNVDKIHNEKSSNEIKNRKQRPTSVYDVEDIHLPPGIVRRTTQEIEEKNRFVFIFKCMSIVSFNKKIDINCNSVD